jgi:hypothetical protein
MPVLNLYVNPRSLPFASRIIYYLSTVSNSQTANRWFWVVVHLLADLVDFHSHR